MIISTKVLWLTVHQIFTAERVAVGCTLPLATLMSAWAKTSLRDTDLEKGLDTLMRTGHIELEMGPEGPTARLLDEGFALLGHSGEDGRVRITLEQIRERRNRVPAHMVSILGPQSGARRRDDPKKTLPVLPTLVPA